MADYMPSSAEEFTSAVQGNKPLNNPGNLRKPKTTEGFMQYPTLEAGRLALEQDLIAKGKKGKTTIEKFLNTYSPSNENQTSSLVANMAKRLGIAPDSEIDLSDPKIRAKVADAVQIQEGYTPIALPGAQDKSVNAQAEARLKRQGSTGLNTGTLPTKAEPESDKVGETLTYVGNLGRSATGGLTDYVAAVPQWAGPDYGKSYTEALAHVREANKQANEANPKAALAGQLSGDVVQGVITAPIGGPLAQAGIQAAASGIQAYTASPEATWEDAMKAAAIGGTVAGAAGVAGKVIEKGQKAYLGYAAKQVNKKGAEIAGKTAEEAAKAEAEAAAVREANLRAHKEWLNNIPESGPVPKAPTPRPVPEVPPLYTHETVTPQQLSEWKQEAFKSEPKAVLWNAAKKTGKEIATGVPQGLGGYFAGEWLSDKIPGIELTPEEGGLAGAALTIGGAKAKALGAAGKFLALNAPELVPRSFNLAGQVGGRVASSGATPEPIKEPPSLIRQEIDKLDEIQAAKKQPYMPSSAQEYLPPSAEAAD